MIGRIIIGATAVGGIAAAGANGGIIPTKASLSSFCIIAFISAIRAPLTSSKVQFPSGYCCSISFVYSIGVASKQSGQRIESVLTSLPPFHPQIQEDPDESMMARKRGVIMMHELYAMHVCMMHVLCNKYQISGQYILPTLFLLHTYSMASFSS